MNSLLWESNFSNINDLSKFWNIEELGPRHYNNELQRYSKDSITCENGELIITMIKNGHDIRSGRINSKCKVEVKFGYIEGVMKFTSGKGLWPAFWLLGNSLGWPHCGEIDIMSG